MELNKIFDRLSIYIWAKLFYLFENLSYIIFPWNAEQTYLIDSSPVKKHSQCIPYTALLVSRNKGLSFMVLYKIFSPVYEFCKMFTNMFKLLFSMLEQFQYLLMKILVLFWFWFFSPVSTFACYQSVLGWHLKLVPFTQKHFLRTRDKLQKKYVALCITQYSKG